MNGFEVLVDLVTTVTSGTKRLLPEKYHPHHPCCLTYSHTCYRKHFCWGEFVTKEMLHVLTEPSQSQHPHMIQICRDSGIIISN